MDRISQVFQMEREKGRKVFIPFVTAGDPDLGTTRRLVLLLEKNGADIIELGVPFSDPLADGPVIQRASQRALACKINLKRICHFVSELRAETEIPIALMSYYNAILHPGLDVSFRMMSDAGVNGLICPDLPPEEGEELINLGHKNGIACVFFLAPTSTQKRIKFVAERASGFIYYVSITGVTGAREDLPLEIQDHLKQIKSVTDKPVAVGFGVSRPEQAARISRWADGVIVGSAIIKILEENPFSEDTFRRIGEFASQIKHAMETS
ncbi:MAG: tryptophan synthase subunit alpha [bacterium]